MEAREERPPLLAQAEVIVGNAIPPFGVIFLGWQAVTVVLLYVLDGWFCILGLGASVMLQNREEIRAMVPKRMGPVRRFFFWVVIVGCFEAAISAFAVIPGILVLAHMGRSPGEAVVQAFSQEGTWLSVAILVLSHAMRIARGSRGPDEGIASLPPKRQMALLTYRMALMMALGWLAAPGFLSRFLVPVYVSFVAVLFTYTELYPRRSLERVMNDKEDRWDDGGDDSQTKPSKAPRPTLPR